MEEVGHHSEEEGGQRVRGNSDHSKRYKSRAVKCQVPGCKHELVQRAYYKRYRICNYHCNLPSLELKEGTVRWCQQCGRFQPLSDFAGDRKTCRAKLNKHNTRRRTARSRARGADDLPDGQGGGSGGQDPASSSTHSESAHPAGGTSPVQAARPPPQHLGGALAQLGSVFKQQGPSVSVVMAGQPLFASPRLAHQPRGGPLEGPGWDRGGGEGPWQGLGLSCRELPWQEQAQPALAQGLAIAPPQQQQQQQKQRLQQQLQAAQYQGFLPLGRHGLQEDNWRGPAAVLAAAASAAAGQGPRRSSPSQDALPPLGQQQWAQLIGTVLPPDFPPLQAAAALPPPPHAQVAGPPLPDPAMDVLRSLNLRELASQIARPPSTAQELAAAPGRSTPSHAPGILSLPSLGLLSDLASCSLSQLCSLGESQLCSELLDVLQQLPGGAELTSALLAAQPAQEEPNAGGGSGGPASSGSGLPSLSSLPQWLGSMSMGLLGERGIGGSGGGGGGDESRGSGNVAAAGTLEAAGSGSGGGGGGDSSVPLAAGPSGSAPALLLEALRSRAGAGPVQDLPSLKQGSGLGGLLPIHPLAVHARPPSAPLLGLDPGASSGATLPHPTPGAAAAPAVAAPVQAQPQRPALDGSSGVRSWQGVQGREVAASPWGALSPGRPPPVQSQEVVQQRWQQVWEAQRQVDGAGAGAGASTSSGGAGVAAAAAAAALTGGASWNGAAFTADGVPASPTPDEPQGGNRGLASLPPSGAPWGEERRDIELHHPPSPLKEAEGHACPKPSSPEARKELNDFLARAALTLFNVPPEKLTPSIREAIANLAAAAEAVAAAGAGQAARGSSADPNNTALDA